MNIMLRLIVLSVVASLLSLAIVVMPVQPSLTSTRVAMGSRICLHPPTAVNATATVGRQIPSSQVGHPNGDTATTMLLVAVIINPGD